MLGGGRDQIQLAYLYVSRTYRGRGVGMQLFEAAVSFTRGAGAKALYVSAAPTENTVDFYLNRGCALAPEPDPALLAPEPDDIHLVYRSDPLCRPPSCKSLRAWKRKLAGASADGTLEAPRQQPGWRLRSPASLTPIPTMTWSFWTPFVGQSTAGFLSE